MIRGALFDMDGLLLDTEALARAAFLETCETLLPSGAPGFDPDVVFLSLIGTSEAATRATLTDALPERIDLPTFGDLWMSRMRARIGQGIPLRPTVGAVIARLSETGLPMAVVTASRTEHARENLAATGLLTHFRAVIGGDAVPAPKPDPAPYRMGAAALGLAPEACAAFEDSDTGTRAARAAGCATWQVPDLRPAGVPLPSLGQRVAATLAEAVAEAGLMPVEQFSADSGAR